MRLRATGLLLAVALTHPRTGRAQSSPHAVQPERPTVATHAGTVAPGFLEIETGGEWDRYPNQSRGSIIPTIFKIGLTPHAQLSLITPIVSAPGSRSLGVGDLAGGVKWRLADSHPLLGRFAVIPGIKLPTGSATTGAGSGTTDLSVVLVSSHSIGPVALDINAGYARRGGDGSLFPRNATSWTVSTGGAAVGAVGWVAEMFGYPGTTGPAGQGSTVAALVGPTFSAKEWLALDLGVIVPIAGSPPRAIYVGGVVNAGRVYP